MKEKQKEEAGSPVTYEKEAGAWLEGFSVNKLHGLIYVLAFSLMVAHFYGRWIDLLFYAGYVAILARCAASDMINKKLPNKLTMGLFLMAPVATVLFKLPLDRNVASTVICFVVLFLLYQLQYVLGRKVIGGGDIKLIVALWFHFGGFFMSMILLIASFSCLTIRLIFGKAGRGIAHSFGEFLALGALSVILTM